MTTRIKGLIVNHSAAHRRDRLHPDGGKVLGLFHRNVKKPVYFPVLDTAQLLKRWEF
jgi:hypothetical protein